MTYSLDMVEPNSSSQNQGDKLALAAGQLVGTPFKLHGRDPAIGVDCVGLVHLCLVAVGCEPREVRGYGLKNRSISSWVDHAEGSGLSNACGTVLPGDVILIFSGPLQYHLVIADHSGSFVHAHAGLRRVVRQRLAITSENFIQKWRVTAVERSQ